MHTRCSLLLGILAVSGCSSSVELEPPPSGSLTLTTDRTVYRNADTIRVVANNLTADTLAYGGCGSMENSAGAVITRDLPCIALLHALPPGPKHVLTWIIDDDTPSGEYRMVVNYIETPDGQALNKADRISQPFRIE